MNATQQRISDVPMSGCSAALEPVRSPYAPTNFSIAKSSPLDKVYERFCAKREAGESVDPDAYCARFPMMRSALKKLIQAHLFVEKNLAVLGDASEIRWPEAGDTFLDFQLLLELGRGAFARVFLAMESKLGNRLVAVKIAVAGGVEAEVLGRLKHPNIVPVYSVTEDKVLGLTAICMPYLGSATLGDVLDKALAAQAPARGAILAAVNDLPYPLDPAVQAAVPETVLRNGTYLDGIRLIGAQLADALAFIHAGGICHRDLKPSNVLMSPEGVPMLLDFNLCTDARHRLGGTFPYMSPEQLRATDTNSPADLPALDGRSDLFSLGVILYELVTGAHPFGPLPLKLSEVELRRFLLERQQRGPVEARRVNPLVDTALSHLIQRCLAADPQDRPQNAGEIASALRRSLAPAARTRRWLRRHPGRALALLVLAMTVAVSGVAAAALRAPYGERQLDTGHRLYQQGRYHEALTHFNDALHADPLNNAARRARARVHQQLGAADRKHYELAMRDYAEADKQTPDGRNKAALGYCLNRAGGRPASARDYYEEAIKSGFATAEVYNNLGFNFLQSNKPIEARKALDRAIELDPKLQAAYHNRAFLVLSKMNQLKPAAKDEEFYRDLKEGIADAKRAIDLGSPSAELYYDAACLCATAAGVEPRWAEPAFQFLTDALRQGYDPGCLESDAFFAPWWDQPAFKKLAHGDRPQQPLPPTQRLVDTAKE